MGKPGCNRPNSTQQQRLAVWDVFLKGLITPQLQLAFNEGGLDALPSHAYKQALRHAAKCLSTPSAADTQFAECGPFRVHVVGKQNVHRFVRKWLQSIWEDRLRGHFDKARSGRKLKTVVPQRTLDLVATQFKLFRYSSVTEACFYNATVRGVMARYKLPPKRMLEYINKHGQVIVKAGLLEFKHVFTQQQREDRLKFAKVHLQPKYWDGPNALMHNVFWVDQKVFYIQVC
jgi:hypothetical protein